MGKEWELTVTEISYICVANQVYDTRTLPACSAIAKAAQKKLVEWIEKEFGYFTDDRLEKIIVDDSGYYGWKGSMAKWQELLKSLGIK